MFLAGFGRKYRALPGLQGMEYTVELDHRPLSLTKAQRMPLSRLPAFPIRIATTIASFFGMVCVLHAQSPARYDVGWAWSNDEVANAGDVFWPQFRGPTGNGHAASKSNPVTQWNEKENILWRTEIPGRGWSSPVAWSDSIWLTTASEDGLSMSAMALDRSTGAIRWSKEVFSNAEMQTDFHVFNSYASPTPTLDGQHLYVSFGAYGTAALKRDTGEVVWQRRDLLCNHYRGAGASPILFKDLLIFHMDGFDFQYIIALDKRTGKTVWKADRDVEYGTDNGDYKKAFGTPQVIEVVDAASQTKQLQLISTTSKAVLAYDPNNGTVLWRVRYEEFSSATRPLFDGQRVFLNTGFSKGKLLAINTGGAGDITATHVAWEAAKAIGSKPSPILVGENICVVDDRGVLTAMEKTTGNVVWQARLGGDFSASPILAGGKIYCVDEKGKTHVYSPDGKEIAVNELETGCLASPAVVGNDLILRTRTSLVCIGDKK